MNKQPRFCCRGFILPVNTGGPGWVQLPSPSLAQCRGEMSSRRQRHSGTRHPLPTSPASSGLECLRPALPCRRPGEVCLEGERIRLTVKITLFLAEFVALSAFSCKMR